MIRVDILDSSPVFLRGLTQVLSDGGIRVVGARTTMDDHSPQEWLADVFMIDPMAVKADLMAHISSTTRLGAVLLVVGHGPSEEAAAALRQACSGSGGVISRQEPEEALVAAVRSVAAGRGVSGRPGARAGSPPAPGEPEQPTVLSNREEQVLAQIAHGLTHSQIAQRLGISRYTVDTYIKRIRAKLGAGNKAELTRLAMLRAFGENAGHMPRTW